MKFRSLAVTNPELVSQWHAAKNGKLGPDEVTSGSKRVVWWRCEHGHEWQATVASRHRGGHCPKCTPSTTSLPEQYLYNAIRRVFPNAVNGAMILLHGIQVELDIYIPDIPLAIEYDGIHHASKVQRDEDKNRRLQRASIQLIRVRCASIPDIAAHGSVVTRHDPHHQISLQECLQFIGNFMQATYPSFAMQAQHLVSWVQEQVQVHDEADLPYPRIASAECLSNRQPRLLREWHPKKNLPLSAEDVTVHSRKRVWWQCAALHEWQATVRYRVKGAPCPFCTGKYTPFEQSIAHAYPTLAKEWNRIRNGERTPATTSPTSQQVVWWTCRNGHDWKMTVQRRVQSIACSCPFCEARHVVSDDPLDKPDKSDIYTTEVP